MSVIVTDNGGTFEAIPTGVFPGVCCSLWDLGFQPGFQGQGQAHKIVLGWEIAERKTEGEWAGKRFVVTKTYTASLNEKANLRKDLESWRGLPFTPEELKGFDLEKVVGVPCMLNLVAQTTKAGKTWTGIAAIMPPVKGSEKLIPETPREYMPKWIQALLGVAQAESAAATEPPFDDDIPF
jgi:hypothetical protein